MPSRTKKFRGYRTHGRGKKSGRGAGIIGGHGKAGYGKTGKIGMLKFDPNYFGRHGFKRPQCMVEANRTINVGELSEQIERFVSILTEAGIDKLLGTGNIDKAVNVTVAEASEKARSKIAEAGGSVAE